jgi:putative phosphoesterase
MDEPVEMILDRLRTSRQVTMLIVSDSHGRTDGIGRLLAQIDRPDLILHLGDHQDPVAEIELEFECPVLGVAGNCDHGFSISPLPAERLIVIAGFRIFMTHGHRYQVKQGLDHLVHTAVKPPFSADLICFGHTHHQLDLEKFVAGRYVRLLNPGSCYPDHRGPHGILVDINCDKISIRTLPDQPTP